MNGSSKAEHSRYSNTWPNRILYWLDDQRKLGRSDGHTITIGTEDLAVVMGTYRRQIMLAVRRLERDGYVHVTRQRTEWGSDLPNKITLLPLQPYKRQQMLQVSRELRITPADVIMMLDRLVADGRPLSVLSISEFNRVTQWNGGRLALLRSFGNAAIIVDGWLRWS